MPEVGAYDAKTHLPQLLERTQKGEHFVITKHGRPVAELIPVTRTDGDTVRRTITNIRSFRETLRNEGFECKDYSGKTKGFAIWLIRDTVTDVVCVG